MAKLDIAQGIFPWVFKLLKGIYNIHDFLFRWF